MKNLGLAAAFVLELVGFIGFASLGLLLPIAHAFQIVLAVILLAALITFWSLCMAPKALKKFPPVPYYVSKAVIYALAALSIFELRGPTLGSLFIIAAILDEALLFRHNLS